MLIFATIGDGDSMLGLDKRLQKLNKKGISPIPYITDRCTVTCNPVIEHSDYMGQ